MIIKKDKTFAKSKESIPFSNPNKQLYPYTQNPHKKTPIFSLSLS